MWARRPVRVLTSGAVLPRSSRPGALAATIAHTLRWLASSWYPAGRVARRARRGSLARGHVLTRAGTVLGLSQVGSQAGRLDCELVARRGCCWPPSDDHRHARACASWSQPHPHSWWRHSCWRWWRSRRRRRRPSWRPTHLRAALSGEAPPPQPQRQAVPPTGNSKLVCARHHRIAEAYGDRG